MAIIQGVLTAAASTYPMKGVENVLAKHPEDEGGVEPGRGLGCHQGQDHRRRPC